MKMLPIQTLQLHPEAKRVPAMQPAEYADFLADVRERGIRVPLEMQPGTTTILDGRSRLTAAKDAGLETVPVVEANINGDDPVQYMIRAASKRRQLTDDQRAMLANEEREWLAAKGKEKKRSNLQPGPKVKNVEANTAVASKTERDRSQDARTQTAATHRVSERKVQQAKRVQDAAPALAEQVKNGEKKLAEAVREIQRTQKVKQMEEKAIAAATDGAQAWRIVTGDCLVELAKFHADSVRLAFADPPYNIGVDYGVGQKADQLPRAEYLSWCGTWMQAVARTLTADGSFWVLINDESAAELKTLLEVAGLHLRQWIPWYESFGVNNPHGFNRTHRHLFWCVKNPGDFVFHAEAEQIRRLSDREAKYGDKRAAPGGKTDVG